MTSANANVGVRNAKRGVAHCDKRVDSWNPPFLAMHVERLVVIVRAGGVNAL